MHPLTLLLNLKSKLTSSTTERQLNKPMVTLKTRFENGARSLGRAITSKPAVCGYLLAGMNAAARAADPTDADGIMTWLTDNKATVIGVAIAFILLALVKRFSKKV